jgi:hypothetical protein
LTERTHRPGAATDDNALFHCSNLQGVILGVGLAILEQQFVEDVTGEGESSERTSKRRKMSPTSEEISPSPIPFFHGRGKPAKGGTGYAGDQKEDVSFRTVFICLLLEQQFSLDVWSAGGMGSTKD